MGDMFEFLGFDQVLEKQKLQKQLEDLKWQNLNQFVEEKQTEIKENSEK